MISIHGRRRWPTRLALVALVTTTQSVVGAEESRRSLVERSRQELQVSTEALLGPLLEVAVGYRLRGRNDDSIALLESGLDITRDATVPLRWRARFLNELGRTLTRARRNDDAKSALDESIECARKSGAPLTHAAALNALGNNQLWMQGFELGDHLDELMSLHQKALAIQRGLVVGSEESEKRVLSGIAESLFQIGFLHEQSGETQKAKEQYLDGVRAAERADDLLNAAFSLRHLGSLAVSDGELDLAESYFRRSLAARQNAGSVAGTGFALKTLAEFLNEHRSSPDAAVKLLDEGLLLMEEANESTGIAIVLLGLANLHESQGRPAMAEAKAKRCLEVADAHGITFVQARAKKLLDRVAAAD